MSNRKKRTYYSETRNAQAEQTKRRVLDAAQKLFQSEGFESVTIGKIAQIAGVSAPTIYALFQSKCGILRAIMDEALPPDQHQTLVENIKQEKSLEKRLMIAAKISRQMYDAERAQMDIFRGAFLLSQELKELEKEREHRRYKRQEESIKATAKERPHIKKLNLSKELDILWAFTGRDMYRLFVIERGWSSDEYETWLAQLLINTLIKTKS